MEPKEAASHATAALYELRRHAEVYDTAFERRDVLEQARAETEAAATKASEDLRYEEAMLRELEKKVAGQRRILDNMRSISTNEIDAEIAKSQTEMAGLNEKIAKAKRDIAETDASLDALHRRLHLG